MSRGWLLFLIVLVGGHIACRAFVWRHLEVDEPEQLVLVQSLAPGYGPQPPLYTWLLYPLVQLLGVSLLPLLLLRLLILGTIFCLGYCLAVRLCADRRCAALAALSLLLLPEVFENLIGKWTHSMLLLVFTLSTLVVTMRLHERRRAWDYALLGICAGLGVLAKYNYVHFAAALGIALLVLPGWRGLLLDRRVLLAAGLALAIASPHLWWVLHNWHEVRAGPARYTIYRAELYQTWPLAARTIANNVSWVLIREAGFLLVPLIIFLPAWRRRRESVSEPRRLLTVLIGAALGLVILLMISGRVIHLRSHWLTPFAVLLPMWLLARFRAEDLSRRRQRAFAACIVAGALGVLGHRVYVTALYQQDGCLRAKERLFAAQIDRLRRDGAWRDGLAVVDNVDLGGFLRMSFPNAQVRCLGLARHTIDDPGTGASVLLASVSSPPDKNPDADFRALVGQFLRDPDKAARLPIDVLHEPAGLDARCRQIRFVLWQRGQ